MDHAPPPPQAINIDAHAVSVFVEAELLGGTIYALLGLMSPS